ncbi:MAG: fasciclin domain-containing protein [Arenimonas sp.]
MNNIATAVSPNSRPLTSDVESEISSERNLIDATNELGEFATFKRVIHAAGLTDTLKGKGPFTVFAPTDEAFAKLPPGKLEELLSPAHNFELRTILNCHIIKGKLSAPELLMASPVKTSLGVSAIFKAKGTNVLINDAATITMKDNEANNGMLHGVDTVLMLDAA